ETPAAPAAEAPAAEAAVATEPATAAAATAAQIESVLTPEGFDLEQVTAIIDASDIPPAQKETLKRLVTSAQSNPALLRSALEQVKAIMQ
ncbi:MAG: hypothetical protein Q4G49_09100, partial [Paracoccus sp. (in: a-proteobacteria)]|nr:hypothetical protein [Paracoccus sp. (in: a-proteobacteria)]